MKRNRIYALLLILGILLSLCGCSPSASGLTMVSVKKTAELKTKGEAYWADQKDRQNIGEAISVIEYGNPLSYVLQYPKTGYPAVDARIEEIVAETRNAFDQEYLPMMQEEEGKKKSVSDTDPILYLGYESYLTDNDQMSLIFFETHETASTSPFTSIHIYHFDLDADEEVSAETLMWTGFRQNASAYTQTYFTETEPYRNGLFGNYAALLAPEAGRFDRFALTPEGVLFYFDRYDLFPGSYGTVSLLIPYEDMQTKIEPPKEEPVSETVQPVDKPMVALTFDDGPNPQNTNAILDTLEKYDVTATFFDLGSLVERYPDVVKREVALGCEVGSHSYDHKNFSKLTDAEIADDIKKTAAAFQKVLGRDPTLFRPPYGSCDERVKKQFSMPLVLWSIDTLDWKSRDADAVMDVIKSAGNLDGKVILMHGIYSSSAEATALLIPYLLEQGYELVTVSELIEAKHGDIPQAGKLYGYSYFQ